MSKIIDIPFNGGQDEGADRILVPDGSFRSLQNCRLDRDGRLNVRPNYVQLTSAVLPGGTLKAFDLTTYQGNLVAIGTKNTAAPWLYGTIPLVLTAAGWAAQQNQDLNLISPVSELENIYQVPFGNSQTSTDIAYANGLLCFTTTDAARKLSCYVMDAITGAVINTKYATAVYGARVCAVGNTFVLVLRNVADSATGFTYDTTTNTGFSGASAFLPAGFGDTFGWDLVPIPTTSNFLMTWSNAADTSMKLRSYNLSFVQQAAISVAARNGNPCVVADGTNVVWCFTNGNNVEMRSLLTSLAAVTLGPTNVLGPAATPATPNIVGTPSIHIAASLRVTIQASAASTVSTALNDSYWTTFVYTGAHTNVTSGNAASIRIASKTVPAAIQTGVNQGIGLGSVIVGGNTVGTDQSYATCLQIVEEQTCTARWNFGFADPLGLAISSNSRYGRASIATDGAGSYWACAGVQDDSAVLTSAAGTLQVVKFKHNSTDRRQSAEMQGALYFAGGYSYYYDGGLIAAESGFLDCPVIVSATQDATGALTLLAAYQYIAVYEWQDTRGRTHRSQPSAQFPVTLTGANNAIQPTVSSPRSLRRATLGGDQNGVKLVLYRNTPLDSVFYRVADGFAKGGTYAGAQTVPDTMADTVAQARPILYTLSQKPTANVGMQPSRFIAAGRDRLIFGGLPDPYSVQFSQLPFPGEPIEGASPNNFAYIARFPEKVTGLDATGDDYIVFTSDAIYQVPGSGPQRNGTGEFAFPHALFTDGGCINWKSIVTCAQGTFFQMGPDRLMLLAAQGGGNGTEAAGAVQFIGAPVRDQLTLFPVITGSCVCTNTQRVVFSCVDSLTAPTGGVLLIYDLRRGVWTVDTIGPVLAVVEYLGRLAYLLSGNVFLENAAIGSGVGALPALSARTGSLKLFGGSGYGMLEKVLLQATYLGAGTIDCQLSTDDGASFNSLGTVDTTTLTNPATGAAIAAGDPITLTWTPKIREVDRFVLQISMTNATDTGGARLHMLSVEVDAKEFATRQPANNRR